MLWLALYLPRLALDIFGRTRSSASPDARAGAEHAPDGSIPLSTDPAADEHGHETPAVVVEARQRVDRVCSCNHAAMACGIRPGMKLSAAQALGDGLRVYRREPAREREALEHLAEWAQQFTPVAVIDPAGAVVLEIGGCLRYFGGLDRLRPRIERELAALGYGCFSASAPTYLAALWLARHQPAGAVAQASGLHSALARLPVSALPLEETRLADFEQIGVRTLGQALALPRAGLSRRFGPEVGDLLDRALGLTPDPREPYRPPERFSRRLELQWAADDTRDLLFVGKRCLLELSGFLGGRGAGVQAVELALSHRDRPPTRLTVGFGKPTRQAEAMFAILRERLERTALPAPVVGFELGAPEPQRLDATPLDLFGDARRTEELDLLMARLKARLGEDAVVAVECIDDHRPEYAWSGTTALAAAERMAPPAPGRAPRAGSRPSAALSGPRPCGPRPERPVWLLPRPEPLCVREERPFYGEPLNCLGRAERIESGWWDEKAVKRDYFVARGPSGRRYWIFRCGSGRAWFVHGLFD